MADNLPREFLHERDARIFALKKSGLSNQDIAKRFDMTAAAVAAAGVVAALAAGLVPLPAARAVLPNPALAAALVMVGALVAASAARR